VLREYGCAEGVREGRQRTQSTFAVSHNCNDTD